MVVGLKEDLRAEETVIESLATRGQYPVTTSQGLSTALLIGAVGFFELYETFFLYLAFTGLH